MSVRYRAVQWNRQKRMYDLVLIAGIVFYLSLFILVGTAVQLNITIETLLIRAFGTAAFLLLHIILSIGPLCRLDTRFLPLLYNRRHMGVAMFILALIHGGLSLFQFHALGDVNPLISLFVSNTHYLEISAFPFQTLGFFALIILFLMAATSHDFWLANLTAPVWKSLHMQVYIAYGLIVVHVTLGALQAETNWMLTTLMGLGIVWVFGLHIVAGQKERRLDQTLWGRESGDFMQVCSVDDIPETHAHIVTLAGERVAVFRYEGRISAVSNVCQHQNGPLGEGCVIDGCITCPWHGYQYRLEDGTSPPPFTEKIPTFDVKIRDGQVYVSRRPNPPGTHVEPAPISD